MFCSVDGSFGIEADRRRSLGGHVEVGGDEGCDGLDGGFPVTRDLRGRGRVANDCFAEKGFWRLLVWHGDVKAHGVGRGASTRGGLGGAEPTAYRRFRTI